LGLNNTYFKVWIKSYKGENFMERPVNLPLGIIPKRIWKEQRLRELRDVIDRYLEANQRVPIEWIEEYNELLEDIRKGVDDNGN
jgi:hypothetical protein